MPGFGTRAVDRDVFFYDFKDPHTQLGGLVLTRGVTDANFYSMIDIVLVISSDYFLQNDNGEELPKDSQPLLPGDYYVITDGTIEVNPEPCLTRALSRSTGTRLKAFRHEVRKRDKRCVVTKRENPFARSGDWESFHSAHIFPLAHEKHWNDHDFDRFITIPPRRGGNINSVQNGLLLRSCVHELFDAYAFSINPDDNYKIIFFRQDVDNVAGTSLDDRLLNDARRPADQLLRWHFRQAVLANMRGAGEPTFELDFPPGSDIMGEIMEGPKAAERMEFELFSRFARHMEVGL